ncbi:FadR/GntR family transcriptional regulator [Hydrogenophaga sp.]|uniref:FadR/GntR family transcriptional regulator n=1 Tax=Hydrogenophaga sp. TaxID=1904254 RepID=UPI002720F6A3|nr:GntR family transcriptional regulator [Hydrogenophaga sp.]MDO9439064.1 GntR family transcriptional regulator [Hydrogenophaga sp.]
MPDASPALRFERVRPQRTFEIVCDQIRGQIADGLLRPGQRLPPEKELVEQFGVSRSGLREALRSLEQAGLIEARTGLNGGFFIRNTGGGGITQSVRDMVSLGQVPTASVIEARIEVTCSAIRLACERATEEELDAIEADIDYHTDLFRQGRGSRNTQRISNFYALLARATHNEVIVMLVDALSEIVRSLLVRIDPSPREDMIQVRRLVLRHIRARNAKRACEVMTQHFRHLHEYLEMHSKDETATAVAAPPAAKKKAAAPAAKKAAPGKRATRARGSAAG